MIESEKKSYDKLVTLSKRFTLLGGIGFLLGWDQETYMPKDAAALRGEQHELLAGIKHEMQTSPEFEKALRALIDLDTGKILTPSFPDELHGSLRAFRRDYLNSVKLPQKLIEEFARITSKAHHNWIEARKENDFSLFEDSLQKIIDLNRKKAEALGFNDHPYDALIDVFEPDMRTQTLTTLFEKLKAPLTDLIKKIQAKPLPDNSFLKGDYEDEKQWEFGKQILHDMGVTENWSRLDRSVHPMCVPIHPTDNRLTTRMENNICNCLFSCIHEGGHALYHGQLPSEHYGTPLCEAASLSIDESQSRSWETIIGRSRAFWEYYFPKLQKHFPKKLADISLDAFCRAINIVEPSMIRVDSDEISYNLHIMLRFEIEKALLEGTLKVKDLPEAWNEKMTEYLGICPKTNAEGCLQDIHWSMGAIGYFPTYALGNLYAAQFMETFAREHPDFSKHLARGDLALIRKWQKDKIHQHGQRYLPGELCEKVTGKPLSEKPFIAYLTQKFTPLYDLK